MFSVTRELCQVELFKKANYTNAGIDSKPRQTAAGHRFLYTKNQIKLDTKIYIERVLAPQNAK